MVLDGDEEAMNVPTWIWFLIGVILVLVIFRMCGHFG